MKLTIIGAGPVTPNAGGASSGYLFTSVKTHVLVDCGPGVVGRLQRYVPYTELTAIIISHFHSDHLLDLVPLRYGLQFAPGAGSRLRPHLYLPPDSIGRLDAVARALDPGDSIEDWRKLMDIAEYDPQATLIVGEFRFTFVPMHHYVPAWGIRVAYEDRVVAYSADTGPSEGVVEVARRADLFLCEATMPEREDAGQWGHLTPAEAGAAARQAGARRLVLTHLWQETDREAMRCQAEATFGGPVDVALEDVSYVL